MPKNGTLRREKPKKAVLPLSKPEFDTERKERAPSIIMYFIFIGVVCPHGADVNIDVYRKK